MKKRILSGLLLMATVAVGFSTFTSCKDTDEDLRTEFTSQQMSLEVALSNLKSVVDDLKANQKPCNCPDLDTWLNNNKGTIESWFVNKVNRDELFGTDGHSGVIGNIQATLDKLPANIDKLTATDLTTLVSLAAQAQSLKELADKKQQLLDLLNKEDNDTKYDDEIAAINKILNGDGTAANPGLKAIVADLDKDINGVNGEGGLRADVNALKDLNKWFDGIGIEDPKVFQDYVNQGQWVIDHKEKFDIIEKNANDAYDYIFGNEKEGIVGKKDLIEKLDGNALDALKNYYTKFGELDEISKLKTMYATLFPEGIKEGDDWWNYDETIKAIQQNQTDIQELQTKVEEIEKKVDRLENNLDNMVTSLVLQTTTNPLFGSINTPFGVNSMVLMAYYGKLTTGLESFPASNQSTEYCGDDVDPDINRINWASMMSGDVSDVAYNPIDFNNTGNLIATNEDKLATLGTLWFTVNPSTVANLDGTFTLVNSVDKEVPVKFEAVKDTETVFKFGFNSRSAEDNGLYRAEAFIDPAELDNIKINIEPGLKDALVDAVKNHTVTDIAHMLKTVYYQLQNVCDANALRYTWNSYDTQNEDGTWNMKENKVYTNYGLAATAFKPLSFHTLYGSSFRKLPHIGSIELSKDLVDLDFKPFKIGNVTLDIDLKIESIQLTEVATTEITVKIPEKYDVNVDSNGSGSATLPENWENTPGMYSTITVDITKDLQGVVNKIQASIDEWIKGVPGNENKPGLNAEINNAIKEAVDNAFNGKDGLVTSIEGQVNDMMGDIQDKVNDLVDKINRDYLGKVNNFVGKVNKVSDRINNVLSDPNHYLQAMMMYKDANGNFHILSTDPKRPSQFKGNGEAIELFATTYNFETICPVFKKFVGVNKVTTANDTASTAALKKAANVADNYMGTVFEGDHQRVALDVKGATNGVYTYEIAYQALDFHGYTSTVKCYIQVIR